MIRHPDSGQYGPVPACTVTAPSRRWKGKPSFSVSPTEGEGTAS